MCIRDSCMFVNVGMWFERYVIIVTTLPRMFLPAEWGNYYPSITDWILFIGTIGMFITLFLLFLRFLPCINIAEVKWTRKNAHAHKDPLSDQVEGYVTEEQVRSGEVA